MALVYWLTYLGFRTLEAGLAFVPLHLCWLLGHCAGWLSYWFQPNRRERVHRNLFLALGDEMGRRECRRIARRHFASLGRNWLCSMKLARAKPGATEKRVKYENRQTLLDLVEEGRGVLAAWTGMGPCQFLHQSVVFGPGVESGLLYAPLPNPFLESLGQRSRAREGVKSYPWNQELSSPMQHLREGGGLAVMMDWTVDDHRVWCPLFGRLTPASNLASLLALRTGAPVVPVGIYADGVARWRICFGEPVRPEVPEDPDEGDGARATAQLLAAMEMLIRRAPEEWYWLNDRWETPPGDFLFGRAGWPVEYASGMESPPLKPFRILVRSPNWLGDACMAVPAVRALKNSRPDAEIAVLCNDNLQELWEHVRHADRVIIKAKKGGLLRVAARISREGPWDAGILFPNSPRSAMEMKLGGVPLIAGYGGRGRSLLLHRRIREREKPAPPEHHAWRYLRIVEALGAHSTDPGLFAPREHQPAETGRWRIGLCPGAAYGDAKRWPVERYAGVVARLHERLGGKVDWVIYGAPKEQAIALRLQESCPVPMENLVGRTSLSELIENLKTVHTLITNDTGTMHLAALLGVKTVAIFGSTEPALTAPLGPGHEVLRVHVDCSPCFLRECPRDFRCMIAIREEDVTEAALRILQPPPAS